ncbi:hypothetical protein [Evansella clarkii]|uniref:hypothetical protein n=1 Tax=Evansella clarkii TaxID=79879 RepID=UPI000B446D65|nr:hypothetical protein [Evansella clarkii]
MTDTGLKQGDAVVMHTCMEAKGHKGRIWFCRRDELKSSSGAPVVFLEGYSGYFHTEYLQKVDISNLLKENENQKYEIEELNQYIKQQKTQEQYLLARLEKAEGQHESATTR